MTAAGVESSAGASAGTAATEIWGRTSFTVGYPTRCPLPATSATLCAPVQSVVDSAGDLWVVDYGNSRVLMYKPGQHTASVVLGQHGSFTTGQGQQDDPDASCNRGRSAGATTLCDPQGVAVAADGTVYVADAANNRVLVYLDAASKTGAAPADLVLGQDNFTRTNYDETPGGGSAPLSCPKPQSSGAPTNCTLFHPMSVGLDAQGDLLVADSLNNRVLEWSASTLADAVAALEGGTLSCAHSCFIPAAAVWGQYGSFTSTDPNNTDVPSALSTACPAPKPASVCTMDMPSDAAIVEGHLIIADYGNNRLLDFASGLDPVSQAAAAVYGQPDGFHNAGDGGTGSASPQSLFDPSRISADPEGDLWVADTINSRVLEYPPPGSAGALTPVAVLGQGQSLSSGTLNLGGVSAQSLAAPSGVSFDAQGDAYVADSDNDRVLEYPASSLPSARVGVTSADPVATAAAASPVVTPPTLLLGPSDLARLQAKVKDGDKTWATLKALANGYTRDTVFPYISDVSWREPSNSIFYDYEGEGWNDAAMDLGLAHLVEPADKAYSKALARLGDELVAAQIRPQNIFPSGRTPIEVDDFYPDRNIGPAAAVIYSWDFASLTPAQRASLIGVMNAWFADLSGDGTGSSIQPFHLNDGAFSNYFVGHMLAAAYMGYATEGVNREAQSMIAWARIRFDGTPSSLVPSSEVPSSTVLEDFEGGLVSAGGQAAAPFADGTDLEGWAYADTTFGGIVDYMNVVRSAGGPNFAAQGTGPTDHYSWLDAMVHGVNADLLPNDFSMDPRGDYGGDVGAIAPKGIAERLAFEMQGTPDGPQAEDLAYTKIAKSPFADIPSYLTAVSPWVAFFYGDTSLPSATMPSPLQYTAFPSGEIGGTAGPDDGLPYFIMRNSASKTATWSSFWAGADFYPGHEHEEAGTIFIDRGGDNLLVSSSDWKCDVPGSCTEGLLGNSDEDIANGDANTLWFNDFGAAQCVGDEYNGDQAYVGGDDVIADEQTSAHTYVRTDLTSAYASPRGSSCDGTGGPGSELPAYYRSFVFLPASDTFVVLDQVTADASPKPYQQYLRWHFPEQPVVSGEDVHEVNGTSGLWVDTVLPAGAAISTVDETQNPDGCIEGQTTGECVSNCDAGPGCVPYGVDPATWRLDVEPASSAPEQTYLSVLQDGASSGGDPTTSPVFASGATMTGTEIVQPSGATTFVLFNSGSGASPTPLSSASFTGSTTKATYLLCGLQPGATYFASKSGETVNVTETGSGDQVTASAAGVVTFTL
jgi:hypothetical protein